MGGDGGGFGGSSGGMVCRAGRVCAIKRGTIKLIAAAGEVGGAFDGCLLDLAGGGIHSWGGQAWLGGGGGLVSGMQGTPR